MSCILFVIVSCMIYPKILTHQLATVYEIVWSKNYQTSIKMHVSRNVVELFLSLCEPCQQKQKGIKKGIVVKPMFFTEFNSWRWVDLIDFQLHPDDKYRFIMVYQDHFIFYHFDIFTLIGASAILQSNNGRDFEIKLYQTYKMIGLNLKYYTENSGIVRAKAVRNELTKTLKTCSLHGCKIKMLHNGVRSTVHLVNEK